MKRLIYKLYKKLACAYGYHRWLYRGSVVGSMDKVHLAECQDCGDKHWVKHARDDRTPPPGELVSTKEYIDNLKEQL